MGTRWNPSGGITGIALLDERINLDTLSASDSDYSQSGPHPGSPVPDDARSLLYVQVAGEQSDDLVIEARSSAMPSGSNASRLAYRKETEADDQLRGWNPPNLITGWIALQYDSADAYCAVHDTTVIPSSQKVVGLYFQVSSPYTVYSVVHNPYGATTASRVALPQVSSTAADRAGGICCLPESERLVAVLHDALGWTAYFSDDAGVTWELLALDVLDTDPAMTTPARARLFVVGDDLVLILCESGRYLQYASTDFGGSFTQVLDWGAVGGVADAVALPSGRIGVASINAGTTRPEWRSIGSAWEDVSGVTAIEIVTSPTSAEVCCWCEPDGRAYVASRNAQQWRLYHSFDDGADWTGYSYGIHESGDASTYPTSISAVCAAGSTFWIHQWAANPGDEDTSLGLLRLGGWSSLTTPHGTTSANRDDARRIGTGPSALASTIQWLPFDEPGDVTAWTPTGAGADQLIGGYLEIVTTANTRYYQTTGAIGAAGEIFATAELRVISGGALATGDITFRAALTTGAYSMAVNFTTTGFRVRDENAGTTLADVTITMTSFLQVAIGIDSLGFGEVFYRRPGASAWSRAYGGALTSGAHASSFTWGHLASATAESEWRTVQIVYGAPGYVWDSADSSSTRHSTITGRSVTSKGVALGDAATAGASFLRALGGPARIGETYQAPVAWDHGVDRLLPLVSPSPAETWRSSDETEQIIAFTPSAISVGTDTALGRSRSVVMALIGANFRYAYLEAAQGAGWGTLGLLDLATGFTGLTATVSGDQVSPDTGATASASRYLQRGEMTGGTAIVNGVYAKILHHEEGGWTQATTRRPRLTVDRAVTAGSCILVSPSGILVVHGITSDYRRFRLRIPAQSTPDGYFQLGAMFLGGLILTGLPWDWGWQSELAPNTTETKDRWGTSRRRQEGPPARTLSFAWPAGVPLQTLRAGVDVGYLSGDASHPALAARADVPWLLDGALREARAGERPCVALQAVPLTSTYTTLTDPSLWLYGRLTGGVSQAQMTGATGSRETVRVETLSIEEIV